MRADSSWGVALRAGLAAGIAGGTAAMAMLVVPASVVGTSPWIVVGMPALPLRGAAALRPRFEPMGALLGLIAHYGVSIAWGVLFALLVHKLTRWLAVPLGVAFGALVWKAMYSGVLPMLGLAMVARSMPRNLVFAQHLVFGLCAGVATFVVMHRAHRRDASSPARSGR